MTEHIHMTCREWEEKLMSTDLENLSDEEMDALSQHLATCSRCASILEDPEIDSLLDEVLTPEQPIHVNLDFLKKGKESSMQKTRKIRPSIFIGLGGTGNEIIRSVKREALAYGVNTLLFQYCVLDTAPYTETATMDALRHLRNEEEYFNIGGYHPDNVLKQEGYEKIFNWWGQRSTEALAEVLNGTGQKRAVGRMGLFVHFDKVKQRLQRFISILNALQTLQQATEQGFEIVDDPPIVYIAFSLGGGTGSSLFLDIACLMRELFKPHVSPEIVAVALLPGFDQPFAKAYRNTSTQLQCDLLQANAYASLKELEQLSMKATYTSERARRRPVWNVQYASDFRVVATEQPFTSFCLLDNASVRNETSSLEHTYARVGRALFRLSYPATDHTIWKETVKSMSGIATAGIHSSGRAIGQLPLYSSFGVSNALLNWSTERVRPHLELLLYEHLLAQPPVAPTLPNFLRNVDSLKDTLIDAINNERYSCYYTQKLGPSGGLISEMIEDHRKKYEEALDKFPHTLEWEHIKEMYGKLAKGSIETFTRVVLSTRGPIATYMALDTILEKIDALHRSLKEKQHEQHVQSQKLDAQCTKLQRDVPTSNNRLVRILLSPSANAISDSLYQWYKARFFRQLYAETSASLLTPLTQFVLGLRNTFKEIGDKIETKRSDAMRAIENVGQQHSMQQQSANAVVHPGHSEKKHLEDAIVLNRINIESIAQQVLQETFQASSLDMSSLSQFELVSDRVLAETLGTLNAEEHLASRLQSRDCIDVKRRFLAEASCPVRFNDEVSMFSSRDTTSLLEYNVSTSQEKSRDSIESALKQFAEELPTMPQLVDTHIESEVALINVVHGFSFSSLQRFDAFYRSYQIIRGMKNAPYLHLCYKEQENFKVKQPYQVRFNVDKLLSTWHEYAEKISSEDPSIIRSLLSALQEFEQHYPDEAPRRAMIDIIDVHHPFFDLLNDLEMTILPPLRETIWTPETTQILQTLEDMEELLAVQGWCKIMPSWYESFDPQLHHRHLEDEPPSSKRAYVYEVVKPGYIRMHAGCKQVRLVEVIVSNQLPDASKQAYGL